MAAEFAAFDFASASLLMALGIGTDVALATLSQASTLTRKRVAWFWIIGVTLTHTLFPMVGYLLTYQSVQIIPMITPVIGVIASAFIAWYIVNVLKEIGAGAQDARPNSRWTVSMGLILAVSWDALWSGPAKSAQVIGWPELFVWLSFVVVGAVIALLAALSLTFAKRLTMMLNQRGNLMLQWLQLSVIGYFGVLALLRYTFALHIHSMNVLLLAFMLTGAAMLCLPTCRHGLLGTRLQN